MRIDDEGPHRYMVLPEACLPMPDQPLKGLWGYTIFSEGGKKVEALLKSKSYRIHKFGPDDKDPKVRGRELRANAESTRPGLLGRGGPDQDRH